MIKYLINKPLLRKGDGYFPSMNLADRYFKLLITSFFPFFLLLLFPDLNYSQSTVSDEKVISGRVIDKISGEALEDVNVYLSYTTKGIATDEYGQFSFGTTLTGQFELVFSIIGYESQKRIVTLGDGTDHLIFEVELIKKPIRLTELEVRADNSDWIRNFDDFSRQFLGETYNASETEIENRWVFNFDRNEDGDLIATADGPIRILNHALGYELLVDLTDFSWNVSEGSGYYLVQIRFKEMEPESGQEFRSWVRNREQAYNGSFRHFLKSLYDDRLARNRFEVVWMDTNQRGRIQPIDQSQLDQSLRFHGLNPGLASQGVKGYLLREPVDILIGRRNVLVDNRKRARLVPMRDDNIFFIMPDGNLADLLAVAIAGYWSTYRIADMVPIDYEPG
ncbi:carboxypeptidase-like regulatory domain-containing protein [Rhodohalobacter barkolensis]|nr:carboxypeptidase-like regulatory domain-containing protein [Rhodohalobacter barkolensis]